MAKSKTKEKDKEKPVGPRARNDAYVMMLFITFVAIVAGTVLMYLDFDEYGGKQPTPPPKIGELSPGGSTDVGTPAPKAAPMP